MWHGALLVSRYRCGLVRCCASAAFAVAVASASVGRARAQQAPEPASAPPGASQGEVSSEDVKASNDPLGALVGLSLHNYYAGSLSELPEASSDTLFLRLATPFGRVLPRFSLPVTSITATGYTASGLGDFNVFAAVRVTNDGAPVSVGIGPLYVAPTATEDALGAGKHQLGAAFTLVVKEGPLMLAALIQYQHSVAGDDDRDDTSVFTPQIFGIYQLGGGYYTRLSPTAIFNFESGNYVVPFGFGLGKVMGLGKTLLNAFVEPQYTFLTKGAGQPVVQIFTGLNIQYKL